MEYIAEHKNIILAVDWDDFYYLSTTGKKGTFYPIGCNQKQAIEIFHNKIKENKSWMKKLIMSFC